MEHIHTGAMPGQRGLRGGAAEESLERVRPFAEYISPLIDVCYQVVRRLSRTTFLPASEGQSGWRLQTHDRREEIRETAQAIPTGSDRHYEAAQ